MTLITLSIDLLTLISGPSVASARALQIASIQEH